MNKYLKYSILGILGILILSMPYTIPIIKTNTEYSIFNKNWNGCMEFAKLLYKNGKLVPIINPYDNYNLNPQGVLIIISPDIDFSNQDSEIIKEFLNNGGILVLVDDFRKGNSLLEKLNISERFSKNPGYDLFYYKNYSLTQTYKVNEYNGVITLDIPSYITTNNGEIQTIYSNKVIMKELNYSNGKIILISDPDIFVNGMKKFNYNFWQYFVEKLDRHIFYIDEVHHSSFALYDMGVVYIQNNTSNTLKFIIFFIILVIAYIFDKINIILNFNKKEIKIDNDDVKKVLEKIKKGKNYDNI